MTPGEAYKTLLIQDQFTTDDSVIAHFVSCVCSLSYHSEIRMRIIQMSERNLRKPFKL
jgi:hypothetical protein